MNTDVTNEMITEAGNEWLRLQYLTNRDHLDNVFTEVSKETYLTLLLLSRKLGLHESKVYLKEISEEMDLPMRVVSTRVQKLQDKGLIYWEHDEGGTYITFSETGLAAVTKQQALLTDMMEKVITRYGYHEFIAFLNQRKALYEVMENVINNA